MKSLKTIAAAALFLPSLAAAQSSAGSEESAFSRVLESARIFRSDVSNRTGGWRPEFEAYCFNFTTPNPYSGRPQPHFFGVSPQGVVGTGDALCRPRVPVSVRTDVPQGTSNLSAIERANLADRLEQCWVTETGAPNIQSIVVELRIEVDAGGVVRTVRPAGPMPTEPRIRMAFEAARRALLDPRCSPLPLPRERLAALRDATFRFNPRDLGLR